MAQWAPYTMVSYQGDIHPIMSPVNMLNNQQQPTTDLLRPHSVAFGQSFYPPMHFQWQQQQPLQPQQPDVTKDHHHVSGLLFPGPHPDLVSSQPCYSNDQSDQSQPTYANDNEQPQYINSREARGASLPPQIQAAEWTPKPPPRSKRASRLGSRTSLTGGGGFDFNPQELTDKLQHLQSEKNHHEAPKRPPRRKKQLFRKSATSHTLPRDFGLHSIAEDENKPMVPMPGGSVQVIDAGSSSDDHHLLMKQPIVPMPKSDFEAAVTPDRKGEKPSIPQPDGFVLLPDHSEYISVTLPLPPNHAKKRSRRKVDPEMRSRANSLHSIRDEIIDGLQKMSASVNVLKQGVVKIYEDLMPPAPQATYASPMKKSATKTNASCTGIEATTQTLEEDPYETVSIKQKLVVDCPPPTATPATFNCTENELSNVEKAFHATFFGIVHEEGIGETSVETALPKDHEIEDVEDDADEVTPTGQDAIKVMFGLFFQCVSTMA